VESLVLRLRRGNRTGSVEEVVTNRLVSGAGSHIVLSNSSPISRRTKGPSIGVSRSAAAFSCRRCRRRRAHRIVDVHRIPLHLG